MHRPLTMALLLALVPAATCMADPVDVATALQLARKHLSHPEAVQTPKARLKRDGGKADGAAYYLFNDASGRGFAIVSGDDRVGGVIGYSDDGHLNPESLSAPLQALLDCYAEAVSQVRTDSISLPPTYVARPRLKVDPMLGCEWNQTYPYNLYTPKTSAGASKPTGCVATAMAQVLYFHKWPVERPSVRVMGEDDAQALDYYDWDAMLPDYNRSHTSHAASAVATLMRDVGKSVRMNYGADGSWSDEIKAWQAFVNNYGYSARYMEKNLMPTGQFLSAVYDELSAGYPVFVRGGDHAFVYDGYDENGLVHANWGWGGTDNGFFDINTAQSSSGLYSSGKYYYQQAALFVRPKDGQHPVFTEQPVVLVAKQSDALAIAEQSVPVGGTLTATLASVGVMNLVQDANGAYTGTVGIGLFDAQGRCLHIFPSPFGKLTWSSTYERRNLDVPANPWLLPLADLDAPLADGRYALRPMCHRLLDEAKGEWEDWRMMYNGNIVGLTVADGTVTPDAPQQHATLRIPRQPQVLSPAQQYSGDLAAVLVEVNNPTSREARAKVELSFIGTGTLEGERYPAPTAWFKSTYVAERHSTTPWILRFATSYSTDQTSALMKAGSYRMELTVNWPNDDGTTESQTFTWPDFKLEVLPMNYQGIVSVTKLAMYADGQETTTACIDAQTVSQIGLAVNTSVSSLRDNALATQLRYRIVDTSDGTTAYTTPGLSVSLPFGAADMTGKTLIDVPVEVLAANRTYEVHVELLRDDVWTDVWNANSTHRRFILEAANPLNNALNVVGGFTLGNYHTVEQAYTAYAASPSDANRQTLADALAETPRIEATAGHVYRLRNLYTDNGTLYLTAQADGTLVARTGEASDACQQFTLQPAEEEGHWLLWNEGIRMYVADTPERNGQLTLTADAASAAAYRLTTSPATYATTPTCLNPADADFSAMQLGKLNRIVAATPEATASQWYVEWLPDVATSLRPTVTAHPSAAPTAVYDLQGRRIKQSATKGKGVYITSDGVKHSGKGGHGL